MTIARTLFSICIPCTNRTYDLKKIMSHLIETANASPPVEIMILDYNSRDDLEEYIKSVRGAKSLVKGNALSCAKYTGRSYYHMAHARNLSVLAAVGEYIVIASTDVILNENFIKIVRALLADQDLVWLCGKKHKSVIVCQKREFVDAGGYDERIEFYGAEDKDLFLRLQRRGKKSGLYPSGLIKVIHTPNKEKIKNYRLKLSKGTMLRRTHAVYDENTANRVLVVNEGKIWGQWA